MFSNYFVTAWRNIINNGLFSVINIFGLSVGLMSCILLMLFVRQETGFDTWIKDSERVVRVHSGYYGANGDTFETLRSVGSMMPTLRDYATNEVESAVRFVRDNPIIQHNGEGFAETTMIVDGSFFDVFDLPFVHGDKSTSFNKPMDLILTEELAYKYFGKTDVVGETLTFCCFSKNTITISVTGVLKNLPNNTHLKFGILMYLNPKLFEGSGILDTWNNNNVFSYFKLNKGVTPEQFQQRIDHWLNHESREAKQLKNTDKNKLKKVTDWRQYKVMPLEDLHLHAKKDAGNMGDLSPMGDGSMINAFIMVAGLVLVIACINFVNLSTARASKRACEVAIRKVVGASQKQVAIQFLVEAIALVFISMCFALIAVELVLPLFNELLGQSIAFDLFAEPEFFISLIFIVIAVGILAGLYPAFYLSRFLPGQILTSSKNNESANSGKLRGTLVVFQFVISIILMISTAVIYSQTLFSTSLDTGFDSNNKLVFFSERAGDNRSTLKRQLLALPEVTSVVFSSEIPTEDHQNNNLYKLISASQKTSGEINDAAVVKRTRLNIHRMDYGFFEAYDVKPIAGRLFDDAYGTDSLTKNSSSKHQGKLGNVIINQSAVKRLGFDNAEHVIGQTLVNGREKTTFTIIGVIPDLYFRSVKFNIRPSIYILDPTRFGKTTVSYETENLAELVNKIEKVWQQVVPMTPLYIESLNHLMASQYESDVIMVQMFFTFSLLAIAIGCLGLYGLSAFIVERRTKEIGLRKVMGAEVKDIVKLLIWQFTKPVLLANVIACPIACYFMFVWLEDFPYRIDTLWLLPICISTFAISLIIAWGTVGTNTMLIARQKPIFALRYE